jgi:sugar lactone lactonase YvrE
VVTPDGRLVVAESAGERLTGFRIADDGSLADRHEWAALAGARPDGICVDAEGAVWVADLAAHEVVRVLEGGRVTHAIATGARWAVAAALGGAERRTLFVCTSGHLAPFAGGGAGQGRIEATVVEVPG